MASIYTFAMYVLKFQVTHPCMYPSTSPPLRQNKVSAPRAYPDLPSANTSTLGYQAITSACACICNGGRAERQTQK